MRTYFSNKIRLKNFRKNLRNKSTSAEAALWKLKKNKQLSGRKFRRQQSLGNYIVDFFCSSEKLIIELDGDPHGDYIQVEKDIERDNFLKKQGYKIIRFENKLVFQDEKYILKKIEENFNQETASP
jgi:very-short-patch-repair endonuclease